jgi:PKD repeat protein
VTPTTWLGVHPPAGIVPPGQCRGTAITLDAAGLAAGDYWSGLVVWSNDPDEGQVTLPVTLTVLEAVAIVDVVTSTNGLEVTFDSTIAGTEPIDYSWDLGDGSTSTETNPIHTYAEGGCYDVSLDVANACGLDSWVGQVCVCDPLHDAGFGWAPLSPFVDDTVVFTATASGTGPITYAWDLGDGTTDTGMTVSHVYTATGVFTVTLTVDGACGGPLVVEHAITVQEHEVEMYTIYLPIVYKTGVK